MWYTQLLEEISKKISQCLPELPDSLQHIKKDFTDKTHLLLQETFSRLDLVNREEFDTQKKVLEKAQAKLKMLSEKMDKLESQLREEKHSTKKTAKKEDKE